MEQRSVIGIGWYLPEQWEKLRRISVDRDQVEESFQEWQANATNALKEMTESGVIVQRVTVDVDILEKWCRERRLAIDAAARSLFVAEHLRTVVG